MNHKASGLAFGSAILVAGLIAFSLAPAAPSTAPPQEGRGDLVQSHDNTNFPLVGRHRTVECGDCHLEGVLAGTPLTCESCHWGRRQEDPYKLQLGTHCDTCHNEEAWGRLDSGAWDHEAVTGFRLEGSHRALDCMQCHGNRGFGGAVAECASCHTQDFERAQDPNHVAAGFPMQCEVCHSGTSSWEGAAFDHSAFRLRGKHRTADCAQCHGGGTFAGISADCVSCHLADYQRTTNPDHQQARFPTECAGCHGASASSWTGAVFDHDRSFPLRGQHQMADCSDCHRNDQFAGTPSNCVACHRDDYDGTTSPNHEAAGFPTDCRSCHGESATGWGTANFDHDRVFPLLGQHRAADCAQCHANNRFSGTPSNCVACHRDDYDRTRDPNHQQSGFGTDCQTCHGISASRWEGASFDHNRVFPLEGAHRGLDCQACHSQGYNLPTNCYGCHADDYRNTNSPNHATAGFPTTCENCHRPSHTSWNQATFNHRFPLTGPHRQDCAECHQSSNFSQFSCIHCHEHERSRMDEKHREVGGYAYNSQACYGCHRDGRED